MFWLLMGAHQKARAKEVSLHILALVSFSKDFASATETTSLLLGERFIAFLEKHEDR